MYSGRFRYPLSAEEGEITMQKVIKQPIFFPTRPNPLDPDLWYFSKFGIWVSQHFWKDANAVEAFVLGLALIAGLSVLFVVGFVVGVRSLKG